MLASGDFVHWAIIKKSDLLAYYTNQAVAIQLSSISCVPYGANMYRRGGYPEDPWVSIRNHGDPAGQLMVYGGNSVSDHNTELQNSGGWYSFIKIKERQH